MSASIYKLPISNLRDEYRDTERKFAPYGYASQAKNPIERNWFFGSFGSVHLNTKESITFESPACVAAPLVTMTATKAINLGVEGRKNQPVAVRLFAPVHLAISAMEVSIGDLQLLQVPDSVHLNCKKLTLTYSAPEEPVHFEIVKSWLINDDTKIETLHIST